MAKIPSHPYPTPPRIKALDGWGAYICQMPGLGIYREGFGLDFQPIWVGILMDLEAISGWILVAFGVTVRLGRPVF